MTQVILGKSRVRETCMPGSVRAKAEWLSYSTNSVGFPTARYTRQSPVIPIGLREIGSKIGSKLRASFRELLKPLRRPAPHWCGRVRPFLWSRSH